MYRTLQLYKSYLLNNYHSNKYAWYTDYSLIIIDKLDCGVKFII